MDNRPTSLDWTHIRAFLAVAETGSLSAAARALGLGAAPTTLALRDQDEVRTALDLPDTFAALCMIPIGYPVGNFGPVTRRSLDEVMRFDRWS